MTRHFSIAFALTLLVATSFGNSVRAALLITPTGTNNSTTSVGGGSGDRALTNSLFVGAAGSNGSVFVGATASTTSRYISGVAADRGAAFSGGTAFAQINTNYTLSFAIADPGVGVVYDLDLTTVIRGALRARDDAAGLSSGGLSRLTNITSSNAALSVVYGGGQLEQGGTSNTTGVAISVFDTRNTTISGLTGAQSINLTFSWVTRAQSPQNVAGGDEHAAIFGAGDFHGGNDTDNYPGAPARNQADDGHFVTATVRVTQVPEPSSALLALTGLFGLAGFRRRKA